MKKLLALALLLTCSLLSARATLFQYFVLLDGPSEFPVNGSLGTGFGTVDYDSIAHTVALSVNFSGLGGNVTASHIHAATAVAGIGTAGVVLTPTTLPGFPAGGTSGSYSTTLNMTLPGTYPAAYITANGGTTAGAEAAITAAFAAGKAYWNIHSTTFGGGEIRGFLTPVPEPSTLALAGLGAVGMAGRAWNKRRARKA